MQSSLLRAGAVALGMTTMCAVVAVFAGSAGATVDTSPPATAIVLAPGVDAQTIVNSQPRGTSFLLAAGVHDRFTVIPKTGDRFYGAQGAILDGGNATVSAFRAFGDGREADSVLVIGASRSHKLVIRNYSNGGQKQVGTIQTTDNTPNGPRRSRNWTVQWVEVANSGVRGITLTDGMVITACYVHDSGRLGIGGSADNVLIQSSRVVHNGWAVDDVSFEAGGIKLVGNGLTVKATKASSNNGPGIHSDVGASNISITDNTANWNTRPGINVELSHYANVERNVTNGNLVEGIRISGSDHVDVGANHVQKNSGGILSGGVTRYGPDGVTYHLDQVLVHDNQVNYSGYTGVPQKLPANQVVAYRSNHYLGAKFIWSSEQMTFKQWQAHGQDLTGTSS